MWEEKAYQIGEHNYDELSVQANEAVSKAGLYAGLFTGGVALTSAYYVNAKSPLYNPGITEYNQKKQDKKDRVKQIADEVVQRSQEEKAKTQTRSAEELAKHREEQRQKNREREEALNRRRAEREAQANTGEWNENNVYHDPVSEEHVREKLQDRMPTQEEIDKARAEASATRQNLDDVAEKLQAAKEETVGSRVDRKKQKDNMLKRALNAVKKTKRL